MVCANDAIASINQNTAADSSSEMNDRNVIGVILARGFPWIASKADVANFFSDINILGGNDAIKLEKRGAMEATFCVQSKKDIRKALAHNNRSDGSRIIHGNEKMFIPSKIYDIHQIFNESLFSQFYN